MKTKESKVGLLFYVALGALARKTGKTIPKEVFKVILALEHREEDLDKIAEVAECSLEVVVWVLEQAHKSRARLKSPVEGASTETSEDLQRAAPSPSQRVTERLLQVREILETLSLPKGVVWLELTYAISNFHGNLTVTVTQYRKGVSVSTTSLHRTGKTGLPYRTNQGVKILEGVGKVVISYHASNKLDLKLTYFQGVME